MTFNKDFVCAWVYDVWQFLTRRLVQMRTFIDLKIVGIIFPLALALAIFPFQSAFCCVNPGGICKDKPEDEAQPCCDGENGEKYECKELTAGYFTCEKKEEGN